MLTPLEVALRALEDEVRRALDRGDDAGLEVLGHGEISCVLRCEAEGRAFAVKRLPPFPDAAALARYRQSFGAYLAALRARGVDVVDSEIHAFEAPGGARSVFCVQPLLRPEQLAPAAFARGGPEALALFDAIVERVLGAVDDRVGLDGQLSNWAVVDGGLRYLDVTTPMLRDAEGRETLDVRLFLASLPWALRAPVRRLLLTSILDTYYDRRSVVRDLLANLIKERLDADMPALIARLPASLSPPIERAEVERYYRGDARVWGALQRLRRVDRAWQRRVRRRPYPFLLPGRIER